MNYDVSNESLALRNLEFEGCHEVPVDIDFSLPDYCPDIQRILKCRVSPNITVRNISGDRLNLEGVANIKIIYLDCETMKIRCCENSSPFSASIDLKIAPENAVALTTARTEYVNCRAVSPRKIDIHGAISICAKIYGKISQNIPCLVSGKDIEQKIENVSSSNLLGIGQQQFSINEIFEVPENMSAPEMIIRSDVILIPQNYKIMPNKVVIKGEAILRVLYVDNLSSGNLETMEYTMPISQIIDVSGIDENARCVIYTEVLSHDEQIREATEQSRGGVETEIKIAATVMAYSEKEFGLISDVYSTDYDLKIQTEPLCLCKVGETVKESFSHKDTFEISGGDISKIIDIWSDFCSASASFKDDKMNFTGKINICVLAADNQDEISYTERIVDFSYNKEFGNSSRNMKAEITAFPASIGHSVQNGKTVDVKIDFNVYGTVYDMQKYNIVTAAEADEAHPANKDRNASLSVYYAEKGEPLWDIARKYYTSVNAIKKENNISEDFAPSGGMMLIPMK